MVSNDSKLSNLTRNDEKKISKKFSPPLIWQNFSKFIFSQGALWKILKTRILIHYYVYFDPVLTKWLDNFFNATSLSNLLCDISPSQILYLFLVIILKNIHLFKYNLRRLNLTKLTFFHAISQLSEKYQNLT